MNVWTCFVLHWEPYRSEVFQHFVPITLSNDPSQLTQIVKNMAWIRLSPTGQRDSHKSQQNFAIWVNLLRCGRFGVLANVVIWLILPVVICLSKRLSHACVSISIVRRNCEWLIKSVIVYLIIESYMDNRDKLQLIHAVRPCPRS